MRFPMEGGGATDAFKKRTLIRGLSKYAIAKMETAPEGAAEHCT